VTSWDCCLGSRSGSHWEMHWERKHALGPDARSDAGSSTRRNRGGTGEALTLGDELGASEPLPHLGVRPGES
jgi:hypothetical protein